MSDTEAQLTKPCPACGGTLVVRTNRQNGSQFLGCTGFPERCTHTEPVPVYLKLLAAGAAPMPGFDL